jgi:hypothetical protein
MTQVLESKLCHREDDRAWILVGFGREGDLDQRMFGNVNGGQVGGN